MNNPVKFAVVLSGCGVYDGAEIQESVLSLLAIMNNNGIYEIFAPDIPQMHVVNHVTGEEMAESRNVLIEAARIARGNIQLLNTFNANDYDVLFFPGGFGGAKNLSDYALKGEGLTVNEEVEKSIKAMHKQGKPIVSLCVTPIMLAKVLGNIKITMGTGQEEAGHVVSFGASHESKAPGEISIDKENKVVTAPCYMNDALITDIALETDLAVKAVLEMV